MLKLIFLNENVLILIKFTPMHVLKVHFDGLVQEKRNFIANELGLRPSSTYLSVLQWHERGALLFFEVIHQISRSQAPKNPDANSNLNS